MRLVVGLMVVATLAGCATKRYPMATPMAADEVRMMDCHDLAIEYVRVQSTRAAIADTARTDWRSVAGWVGDFGIGNAMARGEAEKAASQRLNDVLRAQRQMDCPANAPTSAPPPMLPASASTPDPRDICRREATTERQIRCREAKRRGGVHSVAPDQNAND